MTVMGLLDHGTTLLALVLATIQAPLSISLPCKAILEAGTQARQRGPPGDGELQLYFQVHWGFYI